MDPSKEEGGVLLQTRRGRGRSFPVPRFYHIVTHNQHAKMSSVLDLPLEAIIQQHKAEAQAQVSERALDDISRARTDFP